MKQTRNSAKSEAPTKPPMPQESSVRAQKDSTAGRDQVREVLPVRAPRQPQRPPERGTKGD